MNLNEQIRSQFDKYFFGENWCGVCLIDLLNSINFVQATHKVKNQNSIITIVFHATYYLQALNESIQSKVLTTKDIYSFDTPEIKSNVEWENFKNDIAFKAKQTILNMNSLPDDFMSMPFTDLKYGSNLENFLGILEHLYYHLGQIVLLIKQ